MVPNHRQQVPETALDFLDAPRKLRQPRREFREPLRFELLVAHDGTASVSERGTKRRDELTPGVARIRGKEFIVLRLRAGIPLHVPGSRQGCVFVKGIVEARPGAPSS
jgi:hypothetical protein